MGCSGDDVAQRARHPQTVPIVPQLTHHPQRITYTVAASVPLKSSHLAVAVHVTLQDEYTGCMLQGLDQCFAVPKVLFSRCTLSSQQQINRHSGAFQGGERLCESCIAKTETSHRQEGCSCPFWIVPGP